MNSAVMEAPDMGVPQASAAAAVEFDPFAGGAIEQIVSTTEAQREVWLGDKLSQQASLAYNEAVKLRLRGVLDTRALAATLDSLIARHDSLRATVSPDGTQLMIGEAAPLSLTEHDLAHLDAKAQAKSLDEGCVAAVTEPFSLEEGPLFRAALYRLSPLDNVLLMTAHHAVCDGWSWGVVTEELGQLYAEQIGEGPALEPAAQYAEYAMWEAAETSSRAMQDHVDYWLSRFGGSTLPVLELPVDHPRAAVRSFTSQRIDHLLDRELVDALRKVGAASGTSLFATMFGAFATLLHRLTEQDDLVIGIAAAGQMAADMPTLVGHCVNLLPMRVAVDGQLPFHALVRQSGTALLDAFEHQSLTYGTLLKKLPVPRDPSRLPLVNVLFNVDRDAAPGKGTFPGLEAHASTVARRFENFELFLNVTPVAGGMQVETQYNADLFDEQTVRRWLAMYECLMRSAVQDPSQVLTRMNMLPATEAAVLRALQPAATPVSGPQLMHAGFVTQAAQQPTRAALRAGVTQWSYAELDQRSNRMAHALRARGVQRGQHVGLCLNRSADMVVAMLAILKSGATYIPLDPEFPKARLDYYAEDAKLALLVTDSQTEAAPREWHADAADRLFEIDSNTSWLDLPGESLAPSAKDALPEDPAYVIYTSGSTGKPKGVCVPHGAVANFLQSMRREPSITADDKLAAVTTLSFDIAVLELMLPLIAGAEVVMVPRETAMDGNALAALLDATGATMMQATPGMWRLLVDAQWQGPRGFRALVGGESLPADLAQEMLLRCGEVWNMYGPTETTVWSTLWRVTAAGLADRSVSIGKPIANTTVWIVDAQGQPCPVGIPGEICIGGKGVTLGYLDRPELTAEKFVSDLLGGTEGTMYRTGDRGRWRNDGLLEHMGRFDFQVKVRGYRIELGEIEARCDEAAGVARSVVITREDQPGDVRLVAYLAPSPGASVDLVELDRHLRARLPQYMVPQHVVVLDILPLLPNGKVDRKALPKPEAPQHGAAQRVAPRSEGERRVLEVMEKVLNLPGLGIRDDFFALGGHSLLAARLATLLSREFDITIPLRTLFEAPTAERLNEAVEAIVSSGSPRREPIVHVESRRSAPLTPMQERIRFIEEMHPGRPVYNAPSAHRFGGALDVGRFKAALGEIIRRQPAMRTQMGVDAETSAPVEIIIDDIGYELPVIDLGAIPAEQREAELTARLQEVADRPMDIHRAPLFNAALYKLADDDHVFVFVPHHLIWDGWSFDILQAELNAIYGAMVKGVPHTLPPVPITHGDYADWYAQWLQQPDFHAHLRYWKQRFANAPLPKEPRTDMPRKAGMSGEGGTHWIKVDKALTSGLRDVGRSKDVTLSMLTLGVYVLMMSDVIDTRSIVIATPVRGREAPETESVMGFFNNTLPLSFQIDRSLPFGDFMRYIKQELLSVMNHQEVPFERLVTEPEFAERAQRVGLYQGLFSFQDARDRPREMGGLAYRQMHLLQRGATDDLGMWLMDKGDCLEGAIVYNADVYRHETGAAFNERYAELLRRVSEHPDSTLEALTSSEDSPSATYLSRLAPSNAAAMIADAQRAAESRARPAPDLLLPEQAHLAQVWASALGIDVNDIRASDTFFDLGGDSLLAMRVIQQAEKVMGFRIEPRRYVFENLGQLAVIASGTAFDSVPTASNHDEPKLGLLGRVFSGWSRRR